MFSSIQLQTLEPAGLQRFQVLQADAVSAVTDRFFSDPDSACARYGPAGRNFCQEDLAFHLEFLRPVLEFGLLQPMVDYLCWLSSVLAARAFPSGHLAQSLDWLSEYLGAHMEPADSEVVTAALLAARNGLLAAGTAPPQPPKAPSAWPEAAPFEVALLAANTREALAILNGCLDAGQSLVDFEIHVIQPALYDIGEKWQANQVSVAQEHIATAIVQSVMTAGLMRSAPPALLDKRVLLACVEGNNHAIGLRMVADAFQLGGWDVQYLGANVPTRALLQQVLAWKPDLVGLSVSFPQQLRAAKAAIAQMAEHFGSARPAVVIGGLAINRFNQLATLVGADTCSADAESAFAGASQMVIRQG